MSLKDTEQTALSPKNLLLLDGFGALLSAFLLGIVLVYFESIIGMPRFVLYPLSIAACCFAVYDFACYFGVKKNWGAYLRIIAIVNLLYCCVSLVLVYLHFEQLTALGIAYFAIEKIIVATLAFFELKVAKKAMETER